MSKIKAGTTTTTAYQVEADTTGSLVLQTGSTPTTAVTIGTDQSVTFAQPANLPNTFGMKNRIINGAMMIDQRNAGASVTVTNANPYTLDRWVAYNSAGSSKFTVQQSSTAPAGFTKSLLVTSSSAYSVGSGDYFLLDQIVEGFNWADMDWGNANAKTVTLSFWVRSSLTGTFGGALKSYTGGAYSYPFSYTINSANTWEQKTITIAGPTSTWASSTTNSGAVEVLFSLGTGSTYSGTAGSWAASSYFSATGATSVIGTSGATFYITGVQLEKGSTATSFDYRPYGTELMLCQRYFEKSYDQSVKPGTGSSAGYTTSTIGTNTMIVSQSHASIFFAAEKRTSTPSMTCYGYSGGTSVVSNGNSGVDLAANSGILNTRNSRIASFYNNAGSLATGAGSVMFHWTADAEL